MSGQRTSTGEVILDLLRERGGWTIAELSGAMGVTATAVRQRLNRLMDRGLVVRRSTGSGRGRPSHAYSLTEAGHREAGTNFADLASVLWQEVRGVADVEVRRGLLQRIAARLAGLYASRIRGTGVRERLESIAAIFADRRLPMVVSAAGEQPAADAGGAVVAEGPPALTVLACPYPELAERDRTVCAMERMMLSELAGAPLSLARCRLDDADCCSFVAGPAAGS